MADERYPLSDADQVRMLRKLMLYWDGQWFLKTVETFGLEAAIELNARVRASFGRIEMRVLLQTLGRTRAESLADALRMVNTYGAAFMGDGLRADFTHLDAHHARVIIHRCLAYEGAKRAALPRQDQACVACEVLWKAWLEVLLPECEVQVRYPMRQGLGDPVCQFDIEIPETPSSMTA